MRIKNISVSIMIIFGIAITIVLIISGLCIKNNKTLAVLQSFWLFIILSFNNGGMDYIGNEGIYKASGIQNITFINWAQNLTAEIAKCYGLLYWQYNALLAFFLLILLYFFVKKNTSKISMFYSLFLIYPFTDCVIQKRFFIAFIFCILGLICRKNRNVIGYVIFSIIAMGFHFSAAIMIPMLFIDYFLKKNVQFIGIFFTVEIFSLFLWKNILSFFFDAKVSTYMTRNISLKAGIFFIIFQLSLILITLYLVLPNITYQNLIRNICQNYIARLNVFSLLILPFLMMDATFFRYYRIVMVVSYMEIIDVFNGKFRTNTLRYYVAWGYILAIFLFQVVTVSVGDFGWSEVLQTIFIHNVLLKG